PGLSRPKYHGGTRLSLDQEPRGNRPRVAGEARTDRGLSDADGARLAGLQRDPETGPSVPAHPCPADSRQQRPDRDPHGGGGGGLVYTSSTGPTMVRPS